MNRLKTRIEKIETLELDNPDHQRISEIHRVIIGPGGKPALNDDGSPMVIIRKLGQ